MKRLLLLLLLMNTITVLAGPAIGLSAPSYFFEVVPETVVKTYFVVYNPSDAQVTIHIEVHGLEASLSENDFKLDPSMSKKVYVYITVPETLPASGDISIEPLGAGNIMVGASKQISLNEKEPSVEAKVDVVALVEGKSFYLRVTPNFKSTVSIEFDGNYFSFEETTKEAYACETITFKGKALRSGVSKITVRASGMHTATTEITLEIKGYAGHFYVTYPDEVKLKVGEIKEIELRASRYCSLFIDDYDPEIISLYTPDFLNAGSNIIKIEGLKKGRTELKMHVVHGNITGYITIDVKVRGLGLDFELPIAGNNKDLLIFGGIIGLFAVGLLLRGRS